MGGYLDIKNLERMEDLPGLSEIPPMASNLVCTVQRAKKLAAEWISCCSRKTASECTDEVLQTVTACKKQNPSKKRSCLMSSSDVINGHGCQDQRNSLKEIFNSDID